MNHHQSQTCQKQGLKISTSRLLNYALHYLLLFIICYLLSTMMCSTFYHVLSTVCFAFFFVHCVLYSMCYVLYTMYYLNEPSVKDGALCQQRGYVPTYNTLGARATSRSVQFVDFAFCLSSCKVGWFVDQRRGM